MCYKRLHALGPESTIAIALEKKEKKNIDCQLQWAFPALIFVLDF